MLGVMTFGEIVIDASHTALLTRAFAPLADDATSVWQARSIQFIHLLDEIVQEPAIYLMAEKLREKDFSLIRTVDGYVRRGDVCPAARKTIEAVNGMLAERLAQKHGKASLYAPSSRCRRRSARYNLLNCMFSKATSITATMMMAAM